MIEKISFFVYLLVCFVGFLLVIFCLETDLKQEQRRQKTPFFRFVSATLLLGMLYFIEGHYLYHYRPFTEWFVAERTLDILFYMAHLFFWYRYLQFELELEKRKFVYITDIALACFTFLRGLIQIVFMDGHYYVENTAQRMFSVTVEIAFLFTLIFLTFSYVAFIKRAELIKVKKAYLTFVSIMILLNSFWNEAFTYMLMINSKIIKRMGYRTFDLTSVLLLLILLASAAWFFHKNAGCLFRNGNNAEQKNQKERVLQLSEEFRLTAREQEVVLLLLDGLSYESIAEQLYISKYTVKRHTHNIYKKAEVSTRIELIKRFE